MALRLTPTCGTEHLSREPGEHSRCGGWGGRARGARGAGWLEGQQVGVPVTISGGGFPSPLPGLRGSHLLGLGELTGSGRGDPGGDGLTRAVRVRQGEGHVGDGSGERGRDKQRGSEVLTWTIGEGGAIPRGVEPGAHRAEQRASAL